MTTPRSGSGCLMIAMVLGAVLMAGLAAMMVVFTVSPDLGVGPSKGKGFWLGRRSEQGGVDENPRLPRVWSYGSGDAVVMHIAIRGPILREAGGGLIGRATDPVADVLTCIQDATVDSEVRAILLEVDSPGGEVTASDQIYRALIRFKEAKPGRKVVALLGDVAASGGYYVAVASDYIVAHPTTLTGSIGVLISTLNVKELADKLGIRDVTVKSGPNKDLLNPLKEVRESELALLQEAVDEMHARFIALVARGRRLTEEEVRAVGDGRIMTAQQALQARLVDQIGYWEDALAKTAELLGEPSVRVFRYESRLTWLERLLMSRSGLALWQALTVPRLPRLMYLWGG